MFRKIYAKPHFTLSLVLVFTVMGMLVFPRVKKNLFPDAHRPQIAVVTMEPGAAAVDVASHISRRIEEEVHAIDLVRKVSSVSKDEVSVVMVEFEYEKGLDAAAVDVANAIDKITSQLPGDILPPQVYKISDATSPVMILALSPRPGSGLDLAQVRQIAENQFKDDLLNLEGVADVDIFGGWQREIRIDIDPAAVNRYALTVGDIVAAVAGKNKNIPAGLIISSRNQILLRSADEIGRLDQFADLRLGNGLALRDVARISYGIRDRLSAFHGNGRPAIGVGIMRAHAGNSMSTIKTVRAALPELEKRYANLKVEIADTQGRLINLSIDNMLGALRDAVIMTLLVVFLFLANFRNVLTTSISIIFTYLITISGMYLLGLDFNIVTLTAIILAVGLLLDDAIVVIENIERHYYELGKPAAKAALDGTVEVMLADFAGTITTIIVLVPILFIGGYVQRILRPFCTVLIIALLASYVVSVVIIPLVSPLIMKRDPHKNRLEKLVYRLNDVILTPLVNFYCALVRIFLEKPKTLPLFIIPLMLLMMISRVAVFPLLGRDLMPPMDTGIVKVAFVADSNTPTAASEKLLTRMEKIVYGFKGVRMLSSTLGSEPGAFSFGSGKQPQEGAMTIHFVDRFHRDKSIWQIEAELRDAFMRLPGLDHVNVYDFGATPLSSIVSTVDLMLTGDRLEKLDQLGDEVEKRLSRVPGLTTVSRSWRYDKREYSFTIDQLQAAYYGLTPAEVSTQIGAALKGRVSSLFNIPGENGLGVRVQFAVPFRDRLETLETLMIKTPRGLVPLKMLARIEPVFSPGVITRQNLKYSLDIYGYRDTAAITHIQRGVDRLVMSSVKVPAGYGFSKEGEVAQMNLSMGRLLGAMLIAVIFLYFSLVVTFSSWKNPLTIMFAIPLAAIGSMWFMLAFGRHQCMPSMMGLILLAGVIVNNSILLIDFIVEGLKQGMNRHDAVLAAIRLRARPILMTAVGTSAGMLPVALQWAIGLERLSPLAVVAIGGLMVGTFLTMIYVPIFYLLLERLHDKINAWRGV